MLDIAIATAPLTAMAIPLTIAVPAHTGRPDAELGPSENDRIIGSGQRSGGSRHARQASGANEKWCERLHCWLLLFFSLP